MNKILISLFLYLPFAFSSTNDYDPTWDSLDQRPLPKWYDDAKFGIFMHWGAYAVPSLWDAWFWWDWSQGDPDVVKFMQDNYPPNFTYGDFATQFTIELFEPKEFAKIVKKSGAKYFVLTSKHHEGYTMWPSNYSWNWNSVDVGPHRDIVGDLAEAIRREGIHFGLYYSLYAWFHPLYLKDKEKQYATQEYVQDIVLPQLHEIINTYHPEVLWSDGQWEASSQYWNATEFLAWLYNDSPVKDTVVTNDRWGSDTMCYHGDFYTCADRWNPGTLQKHKWENCQTIDKDSWGYRRNARIADILSINQIIEQLVTTVSCGGNLLLNVGPTHYGKITPIFEERLTQIGEWLKTNGDAVFESKPWIYQNDTLNPDVWYTSKVRSTDELPKNRVYNPQNKENTIVYAFVLKWPDDNQLKMGALNPTKQTKVTMLGYHGEFPFKKLEPTGIMVDLSTVQWIKLPNLWAWVLKIEHLQTDSHTPDMIETGARIFNM